MKRTFIILMQGAFMLFLLVMLVMAAIDFWRCCICPD
jgi:hypothetical protein